LRYEIGTWTADREELQHHSGQIAEVQAWAEALLPDVADQLGEATARPEFFADALELQVAISGVREVIEYYRDRFELYYSPLETYRGWIAGAEWVAADCYQSAMRRAQRLGIRVAVPRMTSPLMQPSTSQEKPRQPRELDVTVPYTLPRRFAPIPIIVLPAPLMANAWGFLAIHHEVGHDVLADLGWPEGSLKAQGYGVVQRALLAKGVEQDRARRWAEWLPELTADFFAVLSAGPAFVGYLMEVLALPHDLATRLPQISNYPSPYLRVHILARFVETLEEGGFLERPRRGEGSCCELAARYRALWEALYNPDGALDKLYGPYLNDIDAYLDLAVDEPFLQVEGGQKEPLRALGTYDRRAHRDVTLVARDLVGDGVTPGNGGVHQKIAPRLLPPAAQLALEALTATDPSPAQLGEFLEAMHATVLEAIEENRPSATLKAFGAEEQARAQNLAQRFREALLASVNQP
jgi:hypothetical protein